MLLHDLAQLLKKRHQNDIQGAVISVAGFRSDPVQQVLFFVFEIRRKATIDEKSNAASCKRPSIHVIIIYGNGGCLSNLPSFSRDIVGFNGERGDHHREDLLKREIYHVGVEGLCSSLTGSCDEVGGERQIGRMSFANGMTL